MKDTIFVVALRQEVNGLDSLLECPIIFSGVGKINSTIATMTAISKGYTNIINIGSCGSLKMKVGQIVKIDTFFQDIDCRPLCDYGVAFEDVDYYIEMSYKTGNSCFTTDYFFDSDNREKYSEDYLKMIEKSTVFDMESYSAAKVCKQYKVNFSSYKWVSDDGQSSDWQNNCKVGLEKIKELLVYEFEKERFQEL